MSNFVSIENKNEVKLKNLYNVAIFMGFVWMLFHFTIVFFFGLILESTLLSGIFLGIGNLVAFIVDIPVGILQKYIKPKISLILSSIIMFLATLIFLKFMFFEGIQDLLPGGSSTLDKTISYLGIFLNSGLNLILLILAACFYGIIKELFDVTTLSYILNNSTPSEYASLISKYNIRYGVGAMLGLLSSGLILTLNTKLAIFILIGIIFLFIFFLNKFFDNDSKYIGLKDLKDLKNLKLDVIKGNLEEKKDNIVKNLNINNLVEVSKSTKLIFLKPIEIKNKIDLKEMFESSKKDILGFKEIIFSKPLNIVLIWVLVVMFNFGFWDTFVSTYQVDFLNKIIGLNQDNFLIRQTGGIMTGYLLLGLLIIPAFIFQDFFIKLSEKRSVIKIILFGNFLSATSMLFFGFVDKIYFVILFGLINSVGYAAVMPIAQAKFSQKYNELYAQRNNLTEIDTTVSAAPLKIVTNVVNVVGLVLGGALVGFLGFNMFFLVFAVLLFGLFVYTFKNGNKLENYGTEKKEDIKIDSDFM